eukprot:g76517.t1
MQAHQVNLRGVRQTEFSSQKPKGPGFRRQLCLGAIVVFTLAFFTFSYVQLRANHISRIPSWKIKPDRFHLPDNPDELDKDENTPKPVLANVIGNKVQPRLDSGIEKVAPVLISNDLRELQESNESQNAFVQSRENIPRLSQPTSKCLNTVQGAWVLTDDTGAVCERKDLLSTGCCNVKTLTAYRTCDGCRQDLGCCTTYEHCVSCCLSHKPPLPIGHLAYPANVFDDCLHYCRISSRSIKHGNLYKRDFLKFCYMEQVNISALVLSHGEIVKGDFNRDCKTTCRGLSKTCVDEYLARLNDCDIVEKYFPCIQCTPGSGAVHPSTVKANAPRPSQQDSLVPGACYINDDIEKSDCTASHPQLRRLCFCLPQADDGATLSRHRSLPGEFDHDTPGPGPQDRLLLDTSSSWQDLTGGGVYGACLNKESTNFTSVGLKREGTPDRAFRQPAGLRARMVPPHEFCKLFKHSRLCQRNQPCQPLQQQRHLVLIAYPAQWPCPFRLQKLLPPPPPSLAPGINTCRLPRSTSSPASPTATAGSSSAGEERKPPGDCKAGLGTPGSRLLANVCAQLSLPAALLRLLAQLEPTARSGTVS